MLLWSGWQRLMPWKFQLGHRSQCHKDFCVSSSLQTAKSNAVSVPRLKLLPQSLRQGSLLHWAIYHTLTVLLPTCFLAAFHPQMCLTEYLPIPNMKEHYLINKRKISRLMTFLYKLKDKFCPPRVFLHWFFWLHKII